MKKVFHLYKSIKNHQRLRMRRLVDATHLAKAVFPQLFPGSCQLVVADAFVCHLTIFGGLLDSADLLSLG